MNYANIINVLVYIKNYERNPQNMFSGSESVLISHSRDWDSP